MKRAAHAPVQRHGRNRDGRDDHLGHVRREPRAAQAPRRTPPSTRPAAAHATPGAGHPAAKHTSAPSAGEHRRVVMPRRHRPDMAAVGRAVLLVQQRVEIDLRLLADARAPARRAHRMHDARRIGVDDRPACSRNANIRSASSRQARVKRSSKPPTRSSATRRTKQFAVANSACARPAASRS